MNQQISYTYSQKEAFLHYLVKMDIDMLELVLDDSITYFGVSKLLFLKKLSDIFQAIGEHDFLWNKEIFELQIKKHRNQNDVYYLKMGSYCFKNKFVIEENNGKITKLYNPKEFWSKNEVDFMSQVELFFYADEKNDFKPDTEYLMNVYRCKVAFEELVKQEKTILNFQDIYYWTNQHADLYSEIKNQYLISKYADFSNLYCWLKNEILDVFEEYQHQVTTALAELKDVKSYDAVKEWIYRNEYIYLCGIMTLDSMITLEESFMISTGRLFRFLMYPNIYFQGKIFFDFMMVLKLCTTNTFSDFLKLKDYYLQNK
jgi:hypothetical protein